MGSAQRPATTALSAGGRASRALRKRIAIGAVSVAAAGLAGGPGAAQAGTAPYPLSLREALMRGVAASGAVAVARGGITAARGQRVAARAERLPQVNGTASYTRTLISQFGSLASGDTTSVPSGCPATPFAPDTTLPLEERVRQLEQAVVCPSASGFDLGAFDLSRAGFGTTNAYRIGLSLSQPLYSGGRIRAQNRVADASLANAELEVTAQNAQVVVDLAGAYYDAQLSVRMLEISETSLANAEQTLRFAELGFRVGDRAEYDVLRARVARNSQRNGVVQARSSRDVAFFRLKQMVDLPLDETIRLTTPLSAEVAATGVGGWIPPGAGDTATDARVPVRQAEQALRIQEGQMAISRAQGRPTVSVVSNYDLNGYPATILPRPSDFADNLTVGLQVSMPVFDGGRVRGSVMQARGAVEQARARLEQAREGAALDARNRVEAVERARAELAGTAGSVEEAQRAYEIAQLQYQQGVASLLEVNDARLALGQAQADRAQATRNLLVARVELLLVRDLPLGTSGGTASQAGASSGAGTQAGGAATTGTGAAGAGGTTGASGTTGTGAAGGTTGTGTSTQGGSGNGTGSTGAGTGSTGTGTTGTPRPGG